MSPRINWNLPIRTRGGSAVRIYDIYEGRYTNGAYYEPIDDVWWPVQWDFNGYYANKKSALDLINVGKEKKIKA